MRNIIIRRICGTAVAGIMLAAMPTVAQTTVEQQTTTTSMGTISELGPERMVIKCETSPEPLTYRFTKTTTYVDENGAPVSIETVKSGLPVTVYYVKEGDNLVASKVVVRKVATADPGSTTIEHKTTTTTTEDK